MKSSSLWSASLIPLLLISGPGSTQDLMGSPPASTYYRNNRPNFEALVKACGQPPYSVRFDGGRVRTMGEVQKDVAAKLAPKLLPKLAAIAKDHTSASPGAAPTPGAAPASDATSGPAPASMTSEDAPISAEFDAAMERGKVYVSDTEAILDVSRAYFCVLGELYPDFASQLVDTEVKFRTAVETIFDPELYKDTPESRALKQSRITAVQNDARSWTKLAASEGAIRQLLPRARYDGGFKFDAVVRANLFSAVDVSACAGAAIRTSAVIDPYILSTLNQINALVAQSITGRGQLAVSRLAASAKSAMDANQEAAPKLTIRDLVCVDALMKALPPAPAPTDSPTPGTPTPAPSPSSSSSPAAPAPTSSPSPTPAETPATPPTPRSEPASSPSLTAS